MSITFESSAGSFPGNCRAEKSKRRSVGFSGMNRDDEDEQDNKENISLADIGIRFKNEESPPTTTTKKKNGRIIIYFGDKMSSSQEDFVEDNVQIVGESLSDMDPALLFAANHFVEDLLVKAQEEASRRKFSETEGLLPGK